MPTKIYRSFQKENLNFCEVLETMENYIMGLNGETVTFKWEKQEYT